MAARGMVALCRRSATLRASSSEQSSLSCAIRAWLAATGAWTLCRVVAVYMTMPDGRPLRFDKSADVPADQLVTIAYTATRGERVEVSCEGMGAAGYETHDVL
jgi:hypothetical protein